MINKTLVEVKKFQLNATVFSLTEQYQPSQIVEFSYGMDWTTKALQTAKSADAPKKHKMIT